MMNKYIAPIAVGAFLIFGIGRVLAQTTEPGTNLPLLPDETATTTLATTTPTYSGLSTATATVTSTVTYSTLTTATATSQTAVDDADTGSEFIFLAILSLTGGVGLFLIKKYFDLKRYSL